MGQAVAERELFGLLPIVSFLWRVLHPRGFDPSVKASRRGHAAHEEIVF